MAHRILIVGSGISGLSAGIYLQKNGYQTEIFEQHYLPGGVCTGWSLLTTATSPTASSSAKST